MEELVPMIEQWFSEKHDYLRVFADSDCRLEGRFSRALE